MSERGSLSPLFTWRTAIVESKLSSSQKLTALVLSLHMNEVGGSAFPSHSRVMRFASLSRATVIRSLGVLEEKGWLRREPGGGRSTTTYHATIPDQSHCETGDQSHDETGGGSRRDSSGRTMRHEQDSDSANEDDKILSRFESFWALYPKRKGKKPGRKEALAVWKRMTDAQRLRAETGVIHYRAACEAGAWIAKDAHRWLSKEVYDDWQEPADLSDRNGHQTFKAPRPEDYGEEIG